MRNIILELITSLDGFIEGPSGEIDWIPFDEEGATYLNSFADEIDTIFYGRTSYELYGNYSTPDSSSQNEKSYWKKVNAMKKYVFTHSKELNFPGAVTISGNIEAVVNDIRNESGKNIWLFGGASLLKTFLQLDLVDEYRISLAPIILGAGKPLFDGSAPKIPLQLIRSKCSATGIVSNHYLRVRK